MSRHRFYVPPERIRQNTVKIKGADVWHITKVLRLGEGDRIYIFDGTGYEYYVFLTERAPKELTGVVLKKEFKGEVESPLKLTLAQALPKADKLDLILQKATELGVHRFIPLKTERVEIKIDSKRLESRQERWRRIVVEAAKQSGRVVIPEVDVPISLETLLTRDYKGVKLLFWEEEKTVKLRSVLEQQKEVREALILIGPEGGFSPEEIKKVREKGFHVVSLGPRVLRTESAAIVVSAILQYEWGDL